MLKELKTADGSITFFSEKFNEAYHSVTAGAFREAVEKFCIPCRVDKKAREKGKVNLFDVCFGLGYNTVAFLDTVFKANPKAKASVVGFEMNLSVIENSLSVNWRSYEGWKPIIRTALKNKGCERGFLTLNYGDEKVRLKIFIGEGRAILKEFGRRFYKFADAIFHDPFSPKVNPELWTYEFFSLLRKIVKDDGIVATYSSASPVRRALLMAGFGVKEGIALGRKSKSTVASPSFKTEEKLLRKLKTSTRAVPFRDLTLNDPPELIKKRQEACVKILERTLALTQIY